jgi:hypothetical protein
MGTQQLLLILLTLLLVAIAIAIGLSIIHAQKAISNRDAIINDLNDLAANANQFKLRPTSLGGGGGTFSGYNIPSPMISNGNAAYSISTAGSATGISFTGTSDQYTAGTVTVTVNADGSSSWTFGDDFQ